MTTVEKIILPGVYDDAFYKKRTNRTGCFLGVDAEQQSRSQELISNAVIGIAGAGGIGGMLAMQMIRLGVRHIKLADPDVFDTTNINRQLGAEVANLGKNKATVVGEYVHRITGDATIEIYPDGVQRHNADDFVSGCDLIFDQTDFYLTTERYALHRAFRNNPRPRCILASCVWAWGANVYKFDRNVLLYDEQLGIPENKTLSDDDVERLFLMQVNYQNRFPSRPYIAEWIKANGNVPIHAVAPPLSCYLLACRACLILCDLEREPYCTILPPVPNYFWFDASTFESGIFQFDGRWVNPDEYNKWFGPDSEFARNRTFSQTAA